MLSIIGYGRNDSHGYNLHKRAAISLNCMAEVLDQPGDEIIFVDYNTPDDLPTFPEAINDTLTDRTKQLLRVIRVRPHHHHPLRNLTHQMAVESLSRNIAIRRANLTNRWVLSTNPDMIFLPRQDGLSLSRAVARLDDGFYHLPRFELPESFWESFDRRDASGILDLLRAHGQRLHINDVVYGNSASLYDGPGDFQLILRSDLEAIHGFHEGMLLGWHVDSNIAKRLQILRGDTRSFLDQFFGYHCDHTRMASIGHGRERVENDLRRFFDDVTVAQVPEQAESWGLAGVDLEELRLAPAARPVFLKALEAALPPPEAPYTEGSCIATPGASHYPAEHVLAYLVDLLAPQRRDLRLVWLGGRRRMLELAVIAWREMGFTGPILVPDSCSTRVHPVTETVSEADALETGDMFVFEFGASSQDSGASINEYSDDDLTILAPVRSAFFTLCGMEKRRIAEGRLPRRVAAINTLSTRFESFVHDAVNVTRTPYSTHMVQGFVIAPAPANDRTPMTRQVIASWLTRRMDRRHPAPITEAVRLVTCLDELLEGCANAERRRLILRTSEHLLALLDYPGLQEQRDPARLDELRLEIQTQRPATTLAPSLSVPMIATALDPAQWPCRLGAVEDWDDDAILGAARKYFDGAFAASVFRTSGRRWTRLAVLAELRRQGVLTPQARALLVSAHVDELHDVLTEEIGHLDVADLSGQEGGLAAVRPAAFRNPSRIAFHAAEHILDGKADRQMVIFTRDALFLGRGLNDATTLLLRAAACLEPGGLLSFAEAVPVGGPVGEDDITPQLAASDAFRQAMAHMAGLDRLATAPPGLSAMTIDFFAATEADTRQPFFLYRDGKRIRAYGVWLFRKTGEPTSDGAGLADALRAINRDGAKQGWAGRGQAGLGP